jgi:hypothetical protein
MPVELHGTKLVPCCRRQGTFARYLCCCIDEPQGASPAVPEIAWTREEVSSRRCGCCVGGKLPKSSAGVQRSSGAFEFSGNDKKGVAGKRGRWNLVALRHLLGDTSYISHFIIIDSDPFSPSHPSNLFKGHQYPNPIIFPPSSPKLRITVILCTLLPRHLYLPRPEKMRRTQWYIPSPSLPLRLLIRHPCLLSKLLNRRNHVHHPC